MGDSSVATVAEIQRGMLACRLRELARKLDLRRLFVRERVHRARYIPLREQERDENDELHSYPANRVKNTKYNLLTFLPLVLWEQFRVFMNLYFLIMAISQLIPAIRISMVFTYWGPLAFVLAVAMIREAIDDFCRYRRDNEMNERKYHRVTQKGIVETAAADIRVGDMIAVHKDQRIPADMVLLRTTEKQGACFIRTDQLDGETDWKLRIAVPCTQSLPDDSAVTTFDGEIYAQKPQRDIHTFLGALKVSSSDGSVHDIPLEIENTLWADAVVASGTAIGCVIYTGPETRSVMNANKPSSKLGLLDKEVNNLTKILFAFTLALSFAMVVANNFKKWYYNLARFIVLFSYIIPISLRVNLDMAKIAYSLLIRHDRHLPGTAVRSSTITEELGRTSYLLSDKTGTLTKNEMVFKKLHLGTVAFASESFEEFAEQIRVGYSMEGDHSFATQKSLSTKAQQAVEAIALCHNVTPIYEDGTLNASAASTNATKDSRKKKKKQKEENVKAEKTFTYQAASPDEVALVSWAEMVGVTLISRDLQEMSLRLPNGKTRSYTILHVFPFTSESKRMGIIVKEQWSGRIVLYMKGADVVMRTLVQYNDWLDEESINMAREGLRTLVVARRILNPNYYAEFDKQYNAARATITNRAENVRAVLERLEKDLQLLALTGVEDSLQDDVRSSLEVLKNAGIKVWMLTGDKQETAICIAKSSGLFAKTESIHVFGNVLNRVEAHSELMALQRRSDVALVITGAALKLCLQYYESETADLMTACTSVVCCRCSPEQKAQLVKLLKKYRSPAIVAAIGDGGNDVAMIQAANAGIGIEAREGKQAAMAADFSVSQFSHICRLMLVHGRYCYKRSCNLSQTVMHRGLLVSFLQAIYSSLNAFVSQAFYPGPLMVLYSTFYTNFALFALVMDKDIDSKTALTYPELYKDLVKGKSLSYKTFIAWLLLALFQESISHVNAISFAGAAIMCSAKFLLSEGESLHVRTITFTALIFTELVTLALTVHKWHWTIIAAQLLSVIIYLSTLFAVSDWFGTFPHESRFIWEMLLTTMCAVLPLYVAKILMRRLAPPDYVKVN